MDTTENNHPRDRKDVLLDRLLNQSPPPQAPDWFEARLMARIRQETAAPPRMGWFAPLRLIGATAFAALLLAAVFAWQGGQDRRGPEISQAEIGEALDALVSYQEEADLWSYDMF